MDKLQQLEDFINNELRYQDPAAQEIVEEILEKIAQIKNA